MIADRSCENTAPRNHAADTSYHGREIWADPSKTVRIAGKVVRMNVPHPVTREASLTQGEIAMWPHECYGINLGRLGSVRMNLEALKAAFDRDEVRAEMRHLPSTKRKRRL
jgi:hypothetical protein